MITNFSYTNRMDVKVSAPGIEKLRATIKNQQKKKKEALNATGSATGASAEGMTSVKEEDYK